MTEFDTCGDDFYRSSIEREEKWVDIVEFLFEDQLESSTQGLAKLEFIK